MIDQLIVSKGLRKAQLGGRQKGHRSLLVFLSRQLSIGLLVVGTGAGVVACTSVAGEKSLQRGPEVGSDGRLTAPFLEEMKTKPGGEGSTDFVWLFPTLLSYDSTAISPSGRRALHWRTDLLVAGLFNVPLLPLYFNSRGRIYDKTGNAASTQLLWTPMYVHSASRGWPDDEPKWGGSGWPLVYSHVVYEAPGDSAQLDIYTTLWSLGPCVISADGFTDNSQAEGWAFMPLALAGVGAIVWASADLRTRDRALVFHGPLFGYAGYRSEVSNDDQSRLILGGLLWYDHEERRQAASTQYSRHGPLWGMIGWGQQNGRQCIYALWIPFQVG
jgi:hypothetical protein